MRNAVTTDFVLGLAAIGPASLAVPDRTISEVNPQQGRVEYKDIPVTVNREHRHLVRHRRLAVDARQADEPQDQLPELHQRPQHDPGRSARRPHRRRERRTSAPRAPTTRHAGPGIGTVGNGGCSGTGKAATSIERRAPSRARTSATSRTTARAHELHGARDGVLCDRAARRRRLRLRAAPRGDEARAQQQPGERGLPPRRRVPRAHLHRRTKTTARWRSRRCSAPRRRRSDRCSRSAATASATPATQGGADRTR